MTMKLFVVEITLTAMVAAEDEMSAHLQAELETSQMVRDGNDLDVQVLREVKGLDQLPEHWEPNCVPYGAARNGAPLRDLLPAVAPVADTKTLNLFEVKPS